MELSKLQRAIISRASAAALGLILFYLAIGCFRWGEGLRTDPETADAFYATARLSGRQKAANPIFLPYGLMVIFGGLGAAFVGFSVVPTRVLYAIDPTPSSTDGLDTI